MCKLQRIGYLVVIVLAVVLVFANAALSAPKRPTTVAEIALYKGADRQQILEEGAKKEGKLVFYTTGTQAKFLEKAFQKKYPYIKVEEWRGGTNEVLPRILEEYKIGKNVVGLIGPTQVAEIVMQEAGMLQSFYSPELASIEEGAIITAPDGGAYAAWHFQSGMGLGYNTKLIKKEQLPKTYQELLDPKWKGKLPISGDSYCVNWMGGLLAAYGEEFVKKMAEQQFRIHMVSGRAMLYIDFDLSREAGEIYKAEGYNSPRKDVANLRDYKKYFGFKSTEEVTRVNRLFSKLFIKK